MAPRTAIHLTLSTLIVGFLALATLACGPPEAGVSAATPAVIERPFAQGGRLTMRLSAGEYTIENSPDDHIRLEWQTREPGAARRVRAQVEVEGASANIQTDGPSNGFVVTIGVPARSDLWIRLSAGDLTIRGIEGHKDVSAWAGELKIGVGAVANYRAVDASVLAGEIQAAPFNGSKGGIFRSFQWSGSGKYELRARLTAGEITFRDN
ncbi:MAG: hypothetical protein JJE40_12025 [Vicinamibacteria bacterium]|nr:hypothetical protein [Vicinamibacteria bacterium]